MVHKQGQVSPAAVLFALVVFGLLLATVPRASASTGYSRPISELLSQVRGAPAVFYLGGPDGDGGVHLALSVSRTGDCTMVDPDTEVAANGRISLRVDGSSSFIELQEVYPIVGQSTEFLVSGSPTGVLRLTATTGNCKGQDLYLIASKRGAKLPEHRLFGELVSRNPLTLAALQKRCSVNDDFYNVCWEILEANERPPGRAIFLMGNSTMREAADAALLSARTGLPVHKLSFSGATEVESLMTFRKLVWRPGDILALHVHPADFTESFVPDPNACMPSVDWDYPPNPINTTRSPFELLADPKTYMEFTPPLDLPSKDDLVSLVLKDTLAFYRMRSILAAAMEPGFDPEPWREIRYSGRDRATVNNTRRAVSDYEAIARVDNARVDSRNVAVRALRAFVAEAERAGVLLLPLGAPINTAVWGPSYDAKTKLDVDAVGREVGLIPAPFELFRDAVHYIDHNHLNAEGRRIYTLWLANLITTAIGGSELATEK